MHTAFSWETVLDDVCFIVGPPVSLGLSAALFPQAGPLVAGLMLLAGTLWLAAQRGTEPPYGVAAQRSSLLSALGNRVVWTLTLVMIAMGTIDVASVAFARLLGEPAAASIVLSLYAIGSCVAGFLFGAAKLTRPIGRLLILGIAATALLTVPLLFVHSLAGLSVAMLISGMFFAPTVILSGQLVESTVPARMLTEALTWSTAGLGLGVAIGPAAAGPLIDAYGANAGFWIAVAAGAFLLVLVIAGRRAFHESATPAEEFVPVPVRCAD
ncbi:MFS transporter [Nocardia sp. CDC159]|uniref:MFS transporter n=1 Tax=Nocardia pulmonis TaxID=2951408 RepID=A0A9X2EBL2_9NOCA|nr:MULTISPECIES: MFS transporter [Nocardia]MCM6776475.1 MFS transporter [Nocardia pulmonis]MCM6788899.1 MFS transporter [Nocardia sp. CDC159]